MTPAQEARRDNLRDFNCWCRRQAIRIRHTLNPHLKTAYPDVRHPDQSRLTNQGVAFHYQGVKRHGAA